MGTPAQYGMGMCRRSRGVLTPLLYVLVLVLCVAMPTSALGVSTQTNLDPPVVSTSLCRVYPDVSDLDTWLDGWCSQRGLDPFSVGMAVVTSEFTDKAEGEGEGAPLLQCLDDFKDVQFGSCTQEVDMYMVNATVSTHGLADSESALPFSLSTPAFSHSLGGLASIMGFHLALGEGKTGTDPDTLVSDVLPSGLVSGMGLDPTLSLRHLATHTSGLIERPAGSLTLDMGSVPPLSALLPQQTASYASPGAHACLDPLNTAMLAVCMAYLTDTHTDMPYSADTACQCVTDTVLTPLGVTEGGYLGDSGVTPHYTEEWFRQNRASDYLAPEAQAEALRTLTPSGNMAVSLIEAARLLGGVVGPSLLSVEGVDRMLGRHYTLGQGLDADRDTNPEIPGMTMGLGQERQQGMLVAGAVSEGTGHASGYSVYNTATQPGSVSCAGIRRLGVYAYANISDRSLVAELLEDFYAHYLSDTYYESLYANDESILPLTRLEKEQGGYAHREMGPASVLSGPAHPVTPFLGIRMLVESEYDSDLLHLVPNPPSDTQGYALYADHIMRQSTPSDRAMYVEIETGGGDNGSETDRPTALFEPDASVSDGTARYHHHRKHKKNRERGVKHQPPMLGLSPSLLLTAMGCILCGITILLYAMLALDPTAHCLRLKLWERLAHNELLVTIAHILWVTAIVLLVGAAAGYGLGIYQIRERAYTVQGGILWWSLFTGGAMLPITGLIVYYRTLVTALHR
ncbi:hypothetical protein KIPB_002476 [Kipferlia bialata]|uniref:Beta-lactamase-related domain-containing protein n=1 Tax=Kipferlia bialata TaxID=797122 RepID=A0A9K3GGA6_9EUKA|nr:hypothetical protein KIPB_002476 [Kipferlia bialata]|eukprot:g2476.t1